MKSFILGFGLAVVAFIGILALLLFPSGNYQPIFHEQLIPSGKQIKVTSFNLVWGVEHDKRFPGYDNFSLEYVSSNLKAEQALQDQEALEVFELIRPASELWGFNTASVSAFRAVRREGVYDIYLFTRTTDGKWTFQRHPAKVHIND